MPSEKATDRAERLLIERILDGTYPSGSELPGERPLSKELGVARPALREALGRLSADGWVTIQQGKATQVNDFLRDGNLNVLIGLLKANPGLMPGFIPNLLDLWILIAPVYTGQAVDHAGRDLAELLWSFRSLDEAPEAYAQGMWQMHRLLIAQGGNPLFGLIFNSFGAFYLRLAEQSFTAAETRAEAHVLWDELFPAVMVQDGERAADLVAAYLCDLREVWQSEDVREWIEQAWVGDDDSEDDKPDSEDEVT